MNCTCANCSTKLRVSGTDLQKAFKCPQCQTIIKLKHRKAGCGNCNKKFHYFPQVFDKNKPYVKCANCDAINKVLL